VAYQDLVDSWHRQRYPNESQRRWEEQQQAEDRAREIVAEYLRQHKYIDVRPTAEEVAAIEARHRIAATKPDWATYLKAAAARAERACRREYDELIERIKQDARQQPD
jgi:hypothetical protein